MENCVFAGTFDPVSSGHINVIKNCAEKYGKVFVILGVNKDKTPTFSEEQRLNFLKKALSGIKNASVFAYSNIPDYAKFIKDNGINYYVRGIRTETDLSFEKKYEKANEKLYPNVKTVYVTVEKEWRDISSTEIRKKLKNGESIAGLVPESIIEDVEKAYKNL